ncbi:MAG: ATP-binding cassette domain-containing protein [Thermodesulfobacteriota bacterium]
MKVELCHIRKYFGPVPASNGVSLTIAPNRIHGLLGENGAGKTTLMRILAGYTGKDGGDIRIDGKAVSFSSPRDAAARGIGLLHQDVLDVPAFSALENFMLGRTPGLRLNRKAFSRIFLKTARDLGFSIRPDDPTVLLTVGERQQADMVRLLSAGTRLLILDEPTTGLSEDQKDVLIAALQKFVSGRGNSVVLVSHKLSDIRQLCDQVTVLRQGAVIGAQDRPFSEDQLLELMFGEGRAPQRRKLRETGEIVFSASGIRASGGRAGLFVADFSVKQKEVIGLAGLDGSGQELFLKASAGLTPAKAGKFVLRGEDVTGRDYHALRQKGVGYIPSDRLYDGLAPDLTIADHFLVAEGAPPFANRSTTALNRAAAAIADFQIKGRPDTPARFLSGGNQQRLLLALIPEKTALLLLDNPTRGLDPESAALVWSRLQTFCDKGGSVVFSSSDLDEMLTMADRIGVFYEGKLAAIFPVEESVLDSLGKVMSGKNRDIGPAAFKRKPPQK